MRTLGQAGQMTIEMILIMTILLGVAISVSELARSSGFMASLVEEPWSVVQGMIENGVWVNAADAKALHPNLRKRHGTPEGAAP